VFIKPRETGEKIYTDQIERLARGLERTGALVIFPEGGNWTPTRWRRGIRRLEHAGRRDLAERARDMPNLLPPRPGGALAAIAACPDADVIFVAHAGLDTITSIGDVWRRFPVDQVIRAKWFRRRRAVPASYLAPWVRCLSRRSISLVMSFSLVGRPPEYSDRKNRLAV
jgi:hypothetical protein